MCGNKKPFLMIKFNIFIAAFIIICTASTLQAEYVYRSIDEDWHYDSDDLELPYLVPRDGNFPVSVEATKVYKQIVKDIKRIFIQMPNNKINIGIIKHPKKFWIRSVFKVINYLFRLVESNYN